MKLFDLINQKPVISASALMIPEFRDLWDRDKSANKEKASAELAYIYFVTDYKSVYQSYDESEREKQIIKDLFDDNWKEDEKVALARDKYDKLQQTPTMGFLKDAMKAVEATRKYFRGVDYSLRDRLGEMIYDPTKVSKMLKDLAGILVSLEKLEQRIKKEQSLTNVTIRGGGIAGIYEDN